MGEFKRGVGWDQGWDGTCVWKEPTGDEFPVSHWKYLPIPVRETRGEIHGWRGWGFGNVLEIVLEIEHLRTTKQMIMDRFLLWSCFRNSVLSRTIQEPWRSGHTDPVSSLLSHHPLLRVLLRPRRGHPWLRNKTLSTSQQSRKTCLLSVLHWMYSFPGLCH